MLSSVDWPVFAAAIATFIATLYITWKGWSDKKEEVRREPATLLGANLQDNYSLTQNSERVRELTEEMEKLRYDLRANTAALTRATDLFLMRRD